ncbi:DUF4834 family protein [Sphingobacterium wenxiniae]|uniref:DUF4834 domain-containing protein n=1 Tax=Sphingobacterium wenxiniae TaxID=683125 RepID=A0A1I6R141_9SPHI|nr:DUF4834 family protein [Sphingobacterium wenxiniae]SFS58385.1 protein of unknown function [Sphingobacterium wenxiniae]
MELLKIIAIFVIVYYALKYTFRLLMPFALRKMTERIMKKAQQSPYNGQQSYQYQYNGQGDPFAQFRQQKTSAGQGGEVRVDYVPQEESRSRKGTETAGEFVDFEEIKN